MVKIFQKLGSWGGVLFCIALAGCAKPVSRGEQLYVNWGCARCHGAQRAGTTLGPAVTGLRENWSQRDLVNYLKTPAAFVEKSKRLQEMKNQYSVQMPGFVTMADEDLNVLVEYLLTP